MRRSSSVTKTPSRRNGRAAARGNRTLKISSQTTGGVLVWSEDEPAGDNAAALGQRLASFNDLFRQPGYGSGLVLVPPDGKYKLVSKGADLASIIMDRVPVAVTKGGEVKGNKIAAAHLNAMLHAESFLGQFPAVDEVTQTPLFLPDWTLTKPGYNDGGFGHRIFFVGGQPEVSDSVAAITMFLDVMDWETNADRTNAVAAGLTVMLRNFWPGGKPIIVATANKSHAGKDTAILFATGESKSTSISWESKGWPVERNSVGALNHSPDTAVLVLENARLDKGDKQIASAFIERLATDPEPLLFSTGTGPPVRRRNTFVVAISTNFGTLCEDILNRSLPIHLATVGDVAARPCPIGNPRHEYLPANKERIGAEFRGMIVRWIEAGCPLDTDVRHPFSEWAKVVGGILMVNGFKGFLANYGTRKATDDPVRNGLGLLGAGKPNEWLSATDWARLAVDLGMKKVVVPPGYQENEKAHARGLGSVLRAHTHETLEAETEMEKVILHLEMKRSRFGSKEPHICYRFVLISREPLAVDDARDDGQDHERQGTRT
jgi:hypothetical protein